MVFVQMQTPANAGSVDMSQIATGRRANFSNMMAPANWWFLMPEVTRFNF
jgi:hypothetical protein